MIPDATTAVSLARDEGLTVATAESLTGGLLAGALTDVPGASEVFVGGIVAYSIAIKTSILKVKESLLADSGPVSEAVARAMAEGARTAFSADVAVATTGVAGPDSHGGKPPGTVAIAAVRSGRSVSALLRIPGNRETVRREAVHEAIVALVTILRPEASWGTTVE